MPGTVFIEQLKRSWRSTLYWGTGVGLLGLYIVSIVQNIEIIAEYQRLLEVFPPAVFRAFGITSVDSLGSVEGFVGFAVFTYAILTLAVYAVFAGLSITANDEDEGIMDVVLALPLARWRVIAEKFAAHTVMTLLIGVIMFVGLFIGTLMTPVDVDLGIMVAGAFNLVPTTLLMIAFTTFVASIFSSKVLASGLSTFFIIGSYFLFTVGGATRDSIAEIIANASFFAYYDVEAVMQDGLHAGNVLLLFVISLALVGISLYAFERRDVRG